MSPEVQPCGLPVCPEHHGLCAYHGDEPDRCPWCHATWASILRRIDHGGRHSCEHTRSLHGRQRRQRIAEALQARLEAAGKPQDRICSTHCAHTYSAQGRARWTPQGAA